MQYQTIREEELKNKIAEDYFWLYDCTKILGNVDFCVCTRKSEDALFEQEFLLWAEAKKGASDVYKSIVQLILTIGKARTFDTYLPPAFLGAFDAEKMAFIPYNAIHEIFYQNDFNWNVAPSNHETKEFKLIYEKVKTTIDHNALLFNYTNDAKELNRFIKENLVVGKLGLTKTRIDKNNFMVIYNKWLQAVKPTISLKWDLLKKNNIIDGDFYLADLLSQENLSLKEKLFVYLKKDHYELARTVDDMGMFQLKRAFFTDKQTAHTQFWNKYERPPKIEYWDYIVERRDLLVPQDVRERKGSFFTPQIWVELSQQYLADVLGQDWQDEYYIWDCAAGTGNLLAGLTNKFHIWASTLDKQDVDVMHDRIDTMNDESISGQGASLLKDHVFQFDFLNDDFTKLPKDLQAVINDPEKRKKLVVYINPPYAEHGTMSAIQGRGKAKTGVSNTTKMHNKFSGEVGTAMRELFVQFFMRIYKEIPDATLASFSTLKFVNSQNFLKFRQYFKAEYKKGFICNANSFDNVKGKFPIGFLIWNLANKQEITSVETDIMLHNNNVSKCWQAGVKPFYAFGKDDFISGWLRKYYDKVNTEIAYLILPGVDMQCQNGVYITAKPTESDILQHKLTGITKNNLTKMVIYLSVRQCIKAKWTNNRDQFLHPNETWQTDTEFKNDCLAFALFHGQNKISAAQGINHWIPFTEQEVDARSKFASNFMTDFIKGKVQSTPANTMFVEEPPAEYGKIEFSTEAKAVFDAGKAVWQYYHAAIKNIPLAQLESEAVNASLYDIRAYFQGRNIGGKMNNKSEDDTYTALQNALRGAVETLADKISPKVYEYSFLKG